jgi:hypothetical protein
MKKRKIGYMVERWEPYLDCWMNAALWNDGWHDGEEIIFIKEGDAVLMKKRFEGLVDQYGNEFRVVRTMQLN